jgi:hypothetical protein
MIFLSWLLDRLKEPTTYLGLTAMLSAAGYVLDPELVQQISAAGVGVSGLILFVLKEKKG